MAIGNLEVGVLSVMAEELLEIGVPSGRIGQTQSLPSPQMVPVAAPTLALTRSEAELFLRIIDSIVEFATDNPLEFHVYCSPAEFKSALERLAVAESSARGQISAGRSAITISSLALTSLLDMEECVSAAKSRRVENVRLALTSSVAGGVLAWITGIPPIGVLASALSIGFLVVKPLLESANGGASEEFRQDVRLSGSQESPFMERVIVPKRPGKTYRHYWGDVTVGIGPRERDFCLVGPDYAIRVEAFEGSVVRPITPWRLGGCPGRARTLSVWTKGERTTSGHGPERQDGDLWVEYEGPRTRGEVRITGPFG